jgi:transcriptional regulator with XRE-family HTH domain
MSKVLLKIREVLKKKEMTQQELANQLGVSKVTVSYWCNNQTVPSLETLKKISTILKVKLTELIKE